MCEIFPEATKCCFCCSLRIGMLFISIASILCGGCIISVLENDVNASYEHTQTMTAAGQFLVNSKDLMFLYTHLFDFAVFLLTVHGFVFIIGGVFLFVSDLFDEEGFAQVFVWVTLLNLCLGFIGLFFMGLHCALKSARCFLDMDWLENSIFVAFGIFFYGMWFYFIVIANSYVVNGDTDSA